MIPMYNTKTFNDIYSNASDFLTDYTNYETSISNVNKIANEFVTITWTLLTAKYGNTPMANMSEDMFKIKLFSIMFQYAPTWCKRLEMQKEIRQLSIADLQGTQKFISNMASNPQTTPSTADLTEIDFIDRQQTSNQLSGKALAYSRLAELLETDVSEFYVGCFHKLFKKVLVPDADYIYVTEDEE